MSAAITRNPLVKRLAIIVAALLALVILISTSGHSHRPIFAHDEPHGNHRASTDPLAPSGLAPVEDDDPSTNNTHQKSFWMPKDQIHATECDVIPSWQLYDLAGNEDLTPTSDPLIYHFHQGRLIDDGYRSFDVRTQFCSVILAPQNPRTNESEFQNLPIEGWGPDAIHLEISSPDIRLVIVDNPLYWGTFSVASRSRNATVVAAYTAPYTLNHPGSYQFNGSVEWQNYDWVLEDPMNVLFTSLPYNMTDNPLRLRSPAIEIGGEPVSRPTQKCRFDSHTDLRGRWYRASSFHPDTGNQTQLNPRAAVEFARYNNTVDEWGWTFAPDNCSLTYFSAQDHKDCLEDRTIQVMGDSNSRRMIKSVIGGGQNWCPSALADDRICQCEDHYQTETWDMDWRELNLSRFRNIEEREDPTVFGRNTSVYFDFVGGLINAKLFNPWSFFFDHGLFSNEPSVMERRVRNHGPMDVVHVSFIGWDAATVRTPTEVLRGLPAFRERLYANYPEGTRFIHRLANANCCGNVNHRTRYSSPRFAMWNHMWRQFFRGDEEEGRIRVYDPSVLQGRRDAETSFLCPTTHFRNSHVRLEQMMWMSAVCEKVGHERARLRSW